MSTLPTKPPKAKRSRWQFSLSTALLVMLIASVVAWCFSSSGPGKNYVERDLALEVKVKVLRGGNPRVMDGKSLEVALVNRSTRLSHLILRHQLHYLYCDAQYRGANGKWTDVPGHGSDDNTPEFDGFVRAKDIVQLRPGSRISKKLPTPWFWMFRDVGPGPALPARFRVRFHCVYQADRLDIELPLTTTDSGGLAYEPDGREPLMAAMRDVPSFHLFSEWVEFTMVP